MIKYVLDKMKTKAEFIQEIPQEKTFKLHRKNKSCRIYVATYLCATGT